MRDNNVVGALEKRISPKKGNARRYILFVVCSFQFCPSISWLWSGKKNYDTVRGAYLEGEPVYPEAKIYNQTHIQICVRNVECILGYFVPTLVLCNDWKPTKPATARHLPANARLTYESMRVSHSSEICSRIASLLCGFNRYRALEIDEEIELVWRW